VNHDEIKLLVLGEEGSRQCLDGAVEGVYLADQVAFNLCGSGDLVKENEVEEGENLTP
jgi:hypothetical protein